MQTLNLLNKNILLFYPFGATIHYGESIKAELERRGAYVMGYDERPSQNSIAKIIIRLFKKKIPYIFSVYIKKIIKKNKNIDFDYILVLRGEAFTKQSIDLLRNKYKNATFILYLWDVLKSNNLKEVIPFFDRAFSFDPEDVLENKKLIFRPTFYIPDYKRIAKKNNIRNEIVFIGTLHSNRYNLLKMIKDYLVNNKITFFYYLYVPSRLIFIKNIYFDRIPINKQIINFTPISLERTLKVIQESKCILDLNFTGQKSLSMRAFEAMASKTKYITINPEIKKYDFYNDTNILVLDIQKLNIPREFINSPFKEIPSSVLDNYSVTKLVDDLFFK